MSIKHHISDDFLIDYASGSLAEGWSLAVASHLALCPECRRRLAIMEGAAGALLDKAEQNGSEDEAWSRFKARAADIRVEEVKPGQAASRPATAVLPEPLR